MSNNSIQVTFLELIKNKIDANTNLVDDLAEKLNVSRDSAYRRLRGETPLTFDEIGILGNAYEISIDQLLNIDSTQVTFYNRNISNEDLDFTEYNKSVLTNLTTLNQFKLKELIFTSRDLPPFHYYQFPELTKFKMFFWQKSIVNNPEFRKQKYVGDLISKELMGITTSIWEKYMIIPSKEIWSDETINKTLWQLDYYFEAGFVKKNIAIKILEEFREMVLHIKAEAAQGKKYFYKRPDTGIENSFELYYNEISSNENTIFFIMDDVKVVYITYNALNTLHTTDKEFCEKIYKHVTNVVQKGTLISSTSEKLRNKIFGKMENRIKNLMDKLIEEKDPNKESL